LLDVVVVVVVGDLNLNGIAIKWRVSEVAIN
jgi:hypothetical protein